ncbi:MULTISPECIES: M9 family metallopeptidase [Pseudoalteromonas]|nr:MULTISPECIES: M9 family metallopeptidase [Pseudoalteromonas]
MTTLVIALSSSASWAKDERETGTFITHNDVAHIHASTSYVPDVMHSDKQTVLKMNLPTQSNITQKSAFETSADVSTCPDTVFSHLSGLVFLQAIREYGSVCIDKLFNDKPLTQVLGAYNDANFSTVITELNERLQSYNGTTDVSYLSDLFYWLKAYAYYDYRRFVNPTTQQAMVGAINTFFANEHFFDKTQSNAKLVRSATGIIKNAQIGEYLVPLTLGLLSKYNESYESINDWGRAATPLFWQVLKSCASDSACRSQQHNPTLVNAIINFIDRNLNWLAKSKNDYHLFNLGYQLVNFYRGSKDAHFSTIEPLLKTYINKVFTNYGPLRDDKERTLYLAVLESVNYQRQCLAFNVCAKQAQIIEQVLSNRKTCSSGTLFIWAQDMNQEQLDWACNSLKAHEDHFHEQLVTNRIPVTPDDNDKLKMVIFNDKKEWVTYGGVLFNVNTNNGGTYREGDPSKAGDQATFYAYEHVSERPVFDIWNLRHEYIHYLEGRFISKGDFSDSDGAGRTVWFGEGVAEYMSLRNCNDGAIAQAKTAPYALSTIFNNEYGVGQTRIYDWGYLSNRFMFERQQSSYFEMLELFKQGKFQEYRTNLVDKWISNKTFDNEFNSWLNTVESKGCSIDSTRPESPVEPIDIDELQGSDMIGVNACDIDDSSIDTSNLKAGYARCIDHLSAHEQVEFALYVDRRIQGASLEISLRHGQGNADVYHEFNRNGHFTKSQGPTNEETLVIEDVQSGWHFISLKANNDVQNTTLLARYIKSVPSNVRVLENGESVPVAIADGGQLMFAMNVPAGASNLSFSTVGGTGELDMHVKFGSEPTKKDYECRPWKRGNKETCTFDNSQVGTYYIMLSADPQFSGATLIGRFDEQ